MKRLPPVTTLLAACLVSASVSGQPAPQTPTIYLKSSWSAALITAFAALAASLLFFAIL